MTALRNAASVDLSHEANVRVGEGTAIFWMNGAIEVSVASSQASRAAATASSTPISAANRASICTLSNAMFAGEDAASPFCHPAITGVPSSKRDSTPGVMRRCV